MSSAKKVFQHCIIDKAREEKKTPPRVPNKIDPNREKMEYEHLRSLLIEKLKDPAMSKKAALIITEMLKNSKVK